MPSNQPGLIIGMLQYVQRQAQLYHGIKSVETSQILLQCTDEACRTAVACGLADKGGRAGDPQTSPLIWKHMGPILTAMILPEDPAWGDVLPKRPTGGTDPWADGLQGFKP